MIISSVFSYMEDFKKALREAEEVLANGGVILYPTDTVWGLGCDATNSEAVEKIYKIKNRADSKSLICLVSDVAMLERHIEEVPEPAYDIIDFSEKPTTIIYDAPKGVAASVIADDNSLGIRVAKDKFCKYLITNFKKPIVSTSANISGAPTPKQFEEIDAKILSAVDYIVPLQPEFNQGAASTIIKIKNNGEVRIIRS
jgi:L-threonylcarbamoyladenylate synthase